MRFNPLIVVEKENILRLLRIHVPIMVMVMNGDHHSYLQICSQCNERWDYDATGGCTVVRMARLVEYLQHDVRGLERKIAEMDEALARLGSKAELTITEAPRQWAIRYVIDEQVMLKAHNGRAMIENSLRGIAAEMFAKLKELRDSGKDNAERLSDALCDSLSNLEKRRRRDQL